MKAIFREFAGMGIPGGPASEAAMVTMSK